MSPYRVLATKDPISVAYTDDRDCDTEIYASMLSTNKKTGARKIYILYKPYPMGYSFKDAKMIAHKMNTQSSAQIMKDYHIEEVKIANGSVRYRVLVCERCIAEDCHQSYRYALHDLQYTLHDCLVYAMHEYLGQQNRRIICEL